MSLSTTICRFYHVYGGTQDNNSLGGPARTRNASGILNSDWYATNGGDGFHSQVDPIDSNIVFAASQNGGIVRFDKRTGERVGIEPIEGKDIESQRYNWDTPFIISPHSNTRLYFAGHKLYRSDNRGDDWKVISGDLSRGLDRNALPVMGKIWGPDAVAKKRLDRALRQRLGAFRIAEKTGPDLCRHRRRPDPDH